jgi:hypothetical protein
LYSCYPYHTGRLPERPMGADCKSVGLRLPRFESWTCHQGGGLFWASGNAFEYPEFSRFVTTRAKLGAHQGAGIASCQGAKPDWLADPVDGRASQPWSGGAGGRLHFIAAARLASRGFSRTSPLTHDAIEALRRERQRLGLRVHVCGHREGLRGVPQPSRDQLGAD